MTQRTFKPYPKGRRALYPNGWPSNLRSVLYLNNRKGREDNSAFQPGQPLEPDSQIYGTTEMSNYG